MALLKRAFVFFVELKGVPPVGIHFDVEPYSMPDWSKNTVTLGNQLVDVYEKLAAAKPAGLYLDADIAMGYAYVSITRRGVTKTLTEWLIEASDRTTLMAYHDYALGPDSIT